MKNLNFITLIIFILSSHALFAQMQLVQSFIEKNNWGTSKFGMSVSNAGDLNGDNIDDFVVGAREYNQHTGRAYVYFGSSSVDIIPDIILDGAVTNSYFATSVASAGDINNDGYDDLIIGAPNYGSNVGRVYLYYGGNPMDTTADVVFNGEGNSNYFGKTVSTAGNVNNDDFDDIIIGAYGYSFSKGRAYIFFGGNSMDNTADVTMTGGASGGYFGISVSNAGNVNNDDYDDVVVGESLRDSQKGYAYVFLGGATMDNTADVIMSGQENYGNFGCSVSTAGDVDNDGYDDVIIGADGMNSHKGVAYLYYGDNSMNNVFDVAFGGANSNAYFGRSVSTAGDINGDNYDDIVIGAPAGNYYPGRVYVFLGNDKNNMDNISDLDMTSENNDDNFGFSVSTVGDINNDGYDDIIVGAYGVRDLTGRTYIYFGGSSPNNVEDLRMDGENTDNNFGYCVSDAGDVNNDGYDDIVVGAPQYNNETGRAYIFFGGSSPDFIADVTMTGEAMYDKFGCSVSSAGDVNGDGYADVIVGAVGKYANVNKAYLFYGATGSSMDNVADGVLNGPSQFGNSVASAGDVNNDGFDDVIVGADGYDSYKGAAYIYYGGSGTSFDNTYDIQLVGENSYNNFGYSVSSVGDVNGDNYDDVIIGAYYYNTSTGLAYLYLGGSSMDTDYDAKMTGENTYNYFGYSVSGAGDVNNDGYDDYMVGAYGNSNYQGKVYIYLGSSSINIENENSVYITLTGELGQQYFAYSISDAGDVNNDGYDDIIVGAYRYGNYIGKAYIYYGDSLMDSTPDLTLLGNSQYLQYGYSVSGAGNFNGLPGDEVIVGENLSPVNGKSYVYTDQNATPVELTTLNATLSESDVILIWQTATEVNNYGFEILRSTLDSEEWEKIGFVEGHGNSYSPKDYVFTDLSVPAGKYLYRLKQLDINGAFEYSNSIEVDLSAPVKYELSQNYPNPFNPTTVIKYSIPEDNFVTIKLYDILGKEITTLVNDYKTTGKYKVLLNGSKLSSGIYIYSIQAGDFKEIKKMILQK